MTGPTDMAHSSTLVESASEETLVSSSMQDIRQSPASNSKVLRANTCTMTMLLRQQYTMIGYTVPMLYLRVILAEL